MYIKSLKVEEGFFDNLDLEFTQGLNVLVGGRGVGKTSVVELLRFGLDSGNLTPNITGDSYSHAVSILQSSGRVTIEMDIDGTPVTVSRSALDKTPISSSNFIAPIIFSQKEIETISMNAEGRLSLIDSFDSQIASEVQYISSLNKQLRSKSAKLAQQKRELSELRESTSQLENLKARESHLVRQQSDMQKQNDSVQNSQNILDDVQSKLASLSVDLQNLNSTKQMFEQITSQIRAIQSPISLQNFHSQEALKINSIIENTTSKNFTLLETIIENNEIALNEVNQTIQSLTSRRLELDETARKNRGNVESYNEGAGVILAELGRVRQNIAQLENIHKIAQEKQKEITKSYDECQACLESIAALKESIRQKRERIIEGLNKNLLPTISTNLFAQSNLNSYAENLESSLRGSGLKYKELIPQIVEKISPAWLLYYTYTLKYNDFAQTLSLAQDRATRLLGYLSEIDLGPILTAKVEDVVHFTLLDHGNYKHVEELSIGQRCTVALSIILENPNRILVVDQPEDHLDNEFIAQTLIKSISQRAQKAQTILSSHNANIPVLGNASNVVNLDSNGRKGFIKCIGGIDSLEIKEVIESIMEGGKEAFQKRSKFYAS